MGLCGSLSDQTWTVCLGSHWYWTLLWSVIFIPPFQFYQQKQNKILFRWLFVVKIFIFMFLFGIFVFVYIFILKCLSTFFFLALFESWLWCLQLVWWNLWNICRFGKKPVPLNRNKEVCEMYIVTYVKDKTLLGTGG